MNPRYPPVAARANHRCEYCRAPEALFNFPLEVEHIIPISRGGMDDESNLALACRACNVFKSNYLTAIDELSGLEVNLFNPRTDRWSDHFALEPDSGQIQGQSAIGRATVFRLSMNDPVQLLARRLWMELGLFL